MYVVHQCTSNTSHSILLSDDVKKKWRYDEQTVLTDIF